jgi:hypothetical protein
MRLQDPEGFAIQDPIARKVHQVPLVVLGPHYEWSGDGHDKLASIGFPIWALHDVWSGKWLGIWVLPNNRLKLAIAYLYLSLVEELSGELVLYIFLCRSHLYTIGMPVQSTTDCGSETTEMYGFASALR